MPDAQPPGWVTRIIDAWAESGPPYVHATFDAAAPEPTLDVTIPLAADLNFSEVPQGTNLRVLVDQISSGRRMAQRITLRGLHEDSSISVVRGDLTHASPETELVWLDSTVLGVVQVAVTGANEAPLTVGADDGCTARFVAAGGAVILSTTLPQTVEVTAAGGIVSVAGRRELLQVTGRVSLSSVPSRDAQPVIGNLLVGNSAALSASSRHPAPVIENLTSRSERTTVRVEPVSQSGETWQVRRIEKLTIESEAAIRIRGLERLHHVDFRGPIEVNIAPGGLADLVTFEANAAGPPKLAAGSGAILEGLSGAVAIETLRGAHLAGSKDGVQLASVDAGGFADAVLTGFTVPQGLQGRQLLAEMSGVFHLDPHTADLPGWDKRWTWTLGRLVRYMRLREAPSAVQSTEPPRRLYHDAEFLRELQRLVIDKGAPGSTRSKVGWCAYRLRELTARRTERLALSVYRWVGYGERPMPALVTWLVVAILSAALVLGGGLDLSWDGFTRLIGEALRQATGPLAGVLHGGESDVDRDWEYLLRAAVAVPLVTGLLALRNYVKSKPSS